MPSVRYNGRRKGAAVALRIAFMGTPDCARPSLERLLADGHELLVLCQPDRPRGRGRSTEAPPVKQCASGSATTVLQPESVNAPEAVAALRAFEPDLACVVAYGQILRREVLTLPRLGCVNLHFSLLPRWRGAAPVQYAILAGDTVSGISTQFMTEGLDEGDVLLSEEMPVDDAVTAGELQDRMALAGAELLSRTVRQIEGGIARPVPQDPAGATRAPRLHPPDGWLDLERPARESVRRIHALNPSPGCAVRFRGEPVKLWRAAWRPGAGEGAPGEVLGVEDEALAIAAPDAVLLLREVQPRGRARQSGRDFANGKRVAPGERLERESGEPIP